jgi:AraC family transcriptional regulator
MLNDYTRRIHLAQDYIRRNVEHDISLADVARAAHFSPYHFHRIFTELQRETPNDYLRRIRVERAAQLLQREPVIPMLSIALQCGFKSQATFARAFRNYFGMTASEWRKGQFWHHDGHMWQWREPIHRKNGKTSDQNMPLEWPHYLARKQELIAAYNGIRPPYILDLRVEMRPALRRAYVWRNGVSPEQILKTWQDALQWGESQGLLTPDCVGISRSLDNAAITGTDLTRYEAGFLVDDAYQAPRGILVDEVPAGQYLVMDFEGTLADESVAVEYLFGYWLRRSEWDVIELEGYVLLEASNMKKELKPDMVIRDQWCFPIKKKRK